ncbi:craniofacial development protein 2-like [Schistocerca serialis cubense]|uniref:craniofacial development protein 2-like n=1 Tax=Schistocerca serialis cubense TaxID=2023355 RepID=UPI00214E879E|nr:craniofacial development protein 2-like [Schistocerca serialis cubense]
MGVICDYKNSAREFSQPLSPQFSNFLPTRGAPVKPSNSAEGWRWCKEKHCIGTWNVRSMYQGKLDIVKREMEKINIDILGISEMRWTDMGEFASDGHMVYYSGHDNNRSNGVAFIVSDKVRKAVIGCKYKNDRMMSIRLQGQPLNITVIQVYAPTTDAEKEIIDQFYGDLQELLLSTPKKDIVFIVGDWNAKVGNEAVEGITGKYGLGTTNEAGQRLLEFCQENSLIITNTLFQLPKRRLYTWTSPDGQHRNQIDYILCNQRWKSAVQSATTRPGADCGSDHELLIAKFQMKLQNVPKIRSANQ